MSNISKRKSSIVMWTGDVKGRKEKWRRREEGRRHAKMNEVPGMR